MLFEILQRASVAVLALVFPVATVVPVPGPVIAFYKEPACKWCAGRRGIVFDSAPGENVRAVVGGHVSFAGKVAGIRYVTVMTGDGWKITYGRLGSTDLLQGDWVVPGQVIGAAGDELFLSLRLGKTPYNPARMFPRRAVLRP